MRPSAILVRPRNPRGIRDFPDLLGEGMRVMVVCGSGQVGLWEDIAAKLGDMDKYRAFRGNIVRFAASSEEAVAAWKSDPGIDAWLTWNIWLAPMRSEAELVDLSPQYRVYRQCSIAMTRRGASLPEAKDFIDFLLSPAGEEVFVSWGWMPRL